MILRSIGLRINQVARLNATFTPARLFASGEQGAWYDPSDLSTMFQGAAGTTPVTAVEQPVGLILDKSKGLALGSELVTNGDFSNGTTGWVDTNVTSSGGTVSVSSGECLVTRGSSRAEFYQTVATVVGKTYKFTGTVVSKTGAANWWIGSTRTNASDLNMSSVAVGTQTGYFRATATTTFITMAVDGTAGQTATIDNISVKEIAGNHASQSTSASRPVLSAMVNLLTYSEALSNGIWVGGPISGATRSAGAITITNSEGYGYISQTLTTLAVPYTLSFDVTCDQTIANVPFRSFVSTGEAETLVSLTAGVSQRVTLSFTPVAGSTGLNFGIDARNVVVPGGSDATGYTVTFNNVDFRITNDGVGLPAYQRIAAATDYDTTGFPLYLRFDGTDDWLATGTVTGFSQPSTILVGGRITNTASALQFFIDGITGLRNAIFKTSATATGIYADATVSFTDAFPQSVYYGFYNGTSSVARQNGVQKNTGNAGTSSASGFRLGADNTGTGYFLTGKIYSVIAVNRALTAAEITGAETYVNSKTRAF